MSHRPVLPAYLRFLKAKLWILAQPSFWGTAIFLATVGLLLREYWINPDFLKFQAQEESNPKAPTDSSFSAEDRAIAADIDNLPALFSDIEQAATNAAANIPKQNSKAKDNQQKLPAVDSNANSGLKLVNPASASNLENPFIVQANNLLQFKNVQGDRQFSETINTGVGKNSIGIGIGLPLNNSQTTLPTSALQTAINQTTNQNQTNSLGRSQPINYLPNSTLIPSPELTKEGNIPGTNSNQLQNPISLPNNSTNLTNTQPPISAVSPVNSAAPFQVTPNNSSWQQPTQLHQYNSLPSQLPEGYKQPGQMNGYSYP